MNVTACVLRLSGLGLAAALVAQPTWAAAAAFDVNDPAAFASASVQLSNLRFRLVDLDPNDTVLPSITFLTPGSQSAVSVNANGRYVSELVPAVLSPKGQVFPAYVEERLPYAAVVSVPGSPTGAPTWLSLPPLSVTSLDGVSQAAATSSSLSASTRLTSADASGGAGPTYDFDTMPDAWMSSSSAEASAGGRALAFSQVFNTVVDPVSGQNVYVRRQAGESLFSGVNDAPAFVLSAKTAVVFEATADARARLDLAKFTDPQLQATELLVGGNALLEVAADVPMTNQLSWATEAEARAALGMVTDQLSILPRRPFGGSNGADLTRAQDLGVTFSNQTDQSLSAHVYSRAYAFAFVNGVGAIPEPSTHALMGLGLAGLALFKRRRAC
jgi:hypothetical protein